MTNKEFAQGLRELAEIYEANEKIKQPEKLEFYLFSATREQFADSVRALAHGGRVEKVPGRDGTDDLCFFAVSRVLPSGLTVQLLTSRSTVCRRVTKMVQVEAWECDPLLDNPTEGGN